MRGSALLTVLVAVAVCLVAAAPRAFADTAEHLSQREEIARDAVRADPDSVGARQRLARVLIDRKRFDAAEQELQAAHKLDPNNPVTQEYLQAIAITRSPGRSAEEKQAVLFALDRLAAEPKPAAAAEASAEAESPSIMAPSERSALDMQYGISTYAYSAEEAGPTSNRRQHILDLRSKRRFADALEFMRADVDDAPAAVSRRLDYVDLLMQVGNYREAGRAIKEGLAIAPEHPLLRIAYDSLLRIAAAQSPAAKRASQLRFSMQLFEAREIRSRMTRRSFDQKR